MVFVATLKCVQDTFAVGFGVWARSPRLGRCRRSPRHAHMHRRIGRTATTAPGTLPARTRARWAQQAWLLCLLHHVRLRLLSAVASACFFSLPHYSSRTSVAAHPSALMRTAYMATAPVDALAARAWASPTVPRLHVCVQGHSTFPLRRLEGHWPVVPHQGLTH